MECSGFEPCATGWKVQMNGGSNGGPPYTRLFRNKKYTLGYLSTSTASLYIEV